MYVTGDNPHVAQGLVPSWGPASGTVMPHLRRRTEGIIVASVGVPDTDAVAKYRYSSAHQASTDS